MTTTPESTTPEEAEADLAQLEQQVIDGGDVTVSDLTAAKERVSFARLVLKGIQDRAEAKRLKDADELRTKTKTKVAQMFTDGEYVDPLVAYDEAVAALDRLALVIKANTALLDDAYREMDRGGVAVVGWDGDQMPHHDPANYVHVAMGDTVTALVTGGVTYSPQEPALWVRAAAHKVAEMHGGLTIPYGPSLESVLRGDIPRVITERAV